MKYALYLTRQAEKHFSALPKSDRGRIKKVLSKMETEPFAGTIKKLTGHDAYRRRVGSYRIIFTVRDTEFVVLVFDVLRRNEKTYRGL